MGRCLRCLLAHRLQGASCLPSRLCVSPCIDNEAWALSGNNHLPETAMNREDGNARSAARTSAPITALPQSAAQPHAALASKADLLQGSWFNQHRHMIAAAAQAWVDDYAASMGAALSYYTLFCSAADHRDCSGGNGVRSGRSARGNRRTVAGDHGRGRRDGGGRHAQSRA